MQNNMFEALARNRCLAVIDARGLCWAASAFAHRTNPEGTEKETYAEILWAFLNRIKTCSERFNTNRFVFAWESPSEHSLRANLYPEYKQSRKTFDSEPVVITGKESVRELEAKRGTIERQEIREVAEPFWLVLQKHLLADMGFVNNFSFDGFEGDDIIGKICKQETTRPIVIVSEDSDMYQLISKNVCQMSARFRGITPGYVSNPTVLDYKRFKHLFGIEPEQWIEVKTLAGCPTDCVPGVKGIGRLSALKYITEGALLRNNGKPSLKQIAIDTAKETGELALWRKLVTIPFEGTPDVKIQPNRYNPSKFFQICTEYNIHNRIDQNFWAEFMDD